MDEAHALVRAFCNNNVSHVSLLCSMFQWFDFLDGQGHARGITSKKWAVLPHFYPGLFTPTHFTLQNGVKTG